MLDQFFYSSLSAGCERRRSVPTKLHLKGFMKQSFNYKPAYFKYPFCSDECHFFSAVQSRTSYVHQTTNWIFERILFIKEKKKKKWAMREPVDDWIWRRHRHVLRPPSWSNFPLAGPIRRHQSLSRAPLRLVTETGADGGKAWSREEEGPIPSFLS